MAKFPRTEAGVIALAQNIIAGLTAADSNFVSPPVSDTDLQTALNNFITKRNEATASEAAARLDIEEKDDALEELTDQMKSVLRYAENTADGDAVKLQELGWSGRAGGTKTLVPEQPRTLQTVQQGESFVHLDWKEPIGGGKVASYKIQRRTRPAGAWEDVGTAIPSEYTLLNQPKSTELEYRIVAINRAGEGMPSNTVAVVL